MTSIVFYFLSRPLFPNGSSELSLQRFCHVCQPEQLTVQSRIDVDADVSHGNRVHFPPRFATSYAAHATAYVAKRERS